MEAASANGHTDTVNTDQPTNNQTNPENSENVIPITDNTGGTALENTNTQIRANGLTIIETPKTYTADGIAYEIHSTPVSPRLAEQEGNNTLIELDATKKKLVTPQQTIAETENSDENEAGTSRRAGEQVPQQEEGPETTTTTGTERITRQRAARLGNGERGREIEER